MNQVPTFTQPTNRKARPEDILVQAEATLSTSIEEIGCRIRVTPNTTFSEHSIIPRIEAALAENRRHLENLPDQNEIDRLAHLASLAISISTQTVVKREVANLIGAFPNAAIANPEIYLAALVFDLLDRQIPDAVVVLTCRKIRRTSKFVPTIAEVLQIAETITDHWGSLSSLSAELRNSRALLQQAVTRGEKILALVREEVEDGYRDPNGMIVRRKLYQGAA